MRNPAKRGELWQVSCSVIWLHSPCRQRYRPIHSQVPGVRFVKRRVVMPLLLAASVVVSLWVAGPFGTIGFLLRAPIILMNDLISIARQAFASPSAFATGQPQIGTSGVTASPVSTTGLAASLDVVRPSVNSAPPSPQPSPIPTPPPGVLVPPPTQILAPVEEILAPAEPVLDPVQSTVDPIVDSVGKTLEPVTGPAE